MTLLSVDVFLCSAPLTVIWKHKGILAVMHCRMGNVTFLATHLFTVVTE